MYDQEVFTSHALFETIATLNKTGKYLVDRHCQVISLPRTQTAQEGMIRHAPNLVYLRNIVRVKIVSLESLLQPSTERLLQIVRDFATGLRTVDLCQRFEAEEVAFLLRRIPNLKSVIGPLRIGPEVCPEELKRIGTVISAVEFTGWFQSESNISLLRSWTKVLHNVFPFIQKLNLSHAVALGDQEAIAIVQAQPCITHLNLNFCIKLTSSALVRVCKSCTSLRSLKVAGIPGCDDSIGSAIKKHLQLRELDLSWCANVGDATVLAITDLQYLSCLRLVGTKASRSSLGHFFYSTKSLQLKLVSLSKNSREKPCRYPEALVEAVLARVEEQEHAFQINQKLLLGDAEQSTEAKIRCALRLPLPHCAIDRRLGLCAYCANDKSEHCESCSLSFCGNCVEFQYCADCTKLVGMVNPDDASETCCGEYYEQNYCNQCDSGFCEDCRTVESCSECEESLCDACGVVLCCTQCCESFCISCRDTVTCSVCSECVCIKCVCQQEWCDACSSCLECCACVAPEKIEAITSSHVSPS